MTKKSCLIWSIGLAMLVIASLVWWEVAARVPGPRHLGKPSDILLLFVSKERNYWWELALQSLWHALVAVIAAAIISTTLLIVALFGDCVHRMIEKLSLWTQVIPIQVLGLVWYVAALPIADFDCLGCFTIFPAALVLIFPPFIYGAKSVDHMSVEIKSAMLVWGIPRYRRVLHVFLPHAVPHVLVGVKLSAAWALPAILVFQSLVVSTGALGPALAPILPT